MRRLRVFPLPLKAVTLSLSPALRRRPGLGGPGQPPLRSAPALPWKRMASSAISSVSATALYSPTFTSWLSAGDKGRGWSDPSPVRVAWALSSQRLPARRPQLYSCRLFLPPRAFSRWTHETSNLLLAGTDTLSHGLISWSFILCSTSMDRESIPHQEPDFPPVTKSSVCYRAECFLCNFILPSGSALQDHTDPCFLCPGRAPET